MPPPPGPIFTIMPPSPWKTSREQFLFQKSRERRYAYFLIQITMLYLFMFKKLICADENLTLLTKIEIVSIKNTLRNQRKLKKKYIAMVSLFFFRRTFFWKFINFCSHIRNKKNYSLTQIAYQLRKHTLVFSQEYIENSEKNVKT